MGFDVVYLVPIHPIGSTNRKGRNNTLTTEPGDPGSPYAIGAADGGHDAHPPRVGHRPGLRTFVRAARKEGLEIALDLALQASPDHPWVREHRSGSRLSPTGRSRTAENPPKKYQGHLPAELRQRSRRHLCRDAAGRAALGRAGREDSSAWTNPHTKPLQFWEWLIAEVNAVDPT